MFSQKRSFEDFVDYGNMITYEVEPKLRYIYHLNRTSNTTFVPVQFNNEELKHQKHCIGCMLAPEYVAIRNNGNAGIIFNNINNIS